MQSITRMHFAGGQRRETLRRRARAQAEQVLALVHVVDARATGSRSPDTGTS